MARDVDVKATEAYGLGPWLPPYEISHGGLRPNYAEVGHSAGGIPVGVTADLADLAGCL